MTPDSSGSLLASGARSLLIGGAALSVIVAVSVASATLFRARPFPDSPRAHANPAARGAASGSGLGLRAEVRGGSLKVTWSHDAGPVRNATSGALTFQDGETRKTLQLNQTTARAGTIFYAAQGTQVQVALTIYAPDHVASESISASIPAATLHSPVLPASEARSEILVPSGDHAGPAPSPEAEHQSRASQTTAAARDHRVAPESSTHPASPREEPAATATPVPELPAPGSSAGPAPGTVAIRVEVDETGRVVEAVMIPQKDLNPEFAEAALEMARDWHFEAPLAGRQRTTRVLQFRQSMNR